jgi:hypothetical protein
LTISTIRRAIYRVWVGAALLALAGCASGAIQPPALLPSAEPSGPPADTAISSSPTPEVALVTLPPSETPRPTDTPEPSATPNLTPSPTIHIDPTFLSFLTTTPTATQNPYSASIRIYGPGPMSKVVTPIDLHVFVESRLAGPAQVELDGEDGRVLYRKSFRTYSFQGQDARLALSVPFEVHAAGELGRLQISTFDSYQRLTAVASVHLLLLSSGENQVTPPGDLEESVLLDSPKSNAEITGGQLNMTGTMRPYNGQPVVVELVAQDGEVLNSRLVALGPADGRYQTLETSLPYQVTGRTPALVVIRQSDDRITGPYYLYSLPVFLSP